MAVVPFACASRFFSGSQTRRERGSGLRVRGVGGLPARPAGFRWMAYDYYFPWAYCFNSLASGNSSHLFFLFPCGCAMYYAIRMCHDVGPEPSPYIQFPLRLVAGLGPPAMGISTSSSNPHPKVSRFSSIAASSPHHNSFSGQCPDRISLLQGMWPTSMCSRYHQPFYFLAMQIGDLDEHRIIERDTYESFSRKNIGACPQTSDVVLPALVT